MSRKKHLPVDLFDPETRIVTTSDGTFTMTQICRRDTGCGPWYVLGEGVAKRRRGDARNFGLAVDLTTIRALEDMAHRSRLKLFEYAPEAMDISPEAAQSFRREISESKAAYGREQDAATARFMSAVMGVEMPTLEDLLTETEKDAE
jgi:hypothetical protein